MPRQQTSMSQPRDLDKTRTAGCIRAARAALRAAGDLDHALAAIGRVGKLGITILVAVIRIRIIGARRNSGRVTARFLTMLVSLLE